MKVTSQSVLAGQTIQFGEGDYFRLLTCPNPVTVDLNAIGGSPRDQFVSVTGGIGFASRDPAGNRLTYGSGKITSPSTQTIVYAYGYGDISYDIAQGTVTVTQAGTLTSLPDVSVASVTASVVSLFNAAKRETLVSNLTANTAVLRVGGATTGAASGMELGPGQTATISGSAAVSIYNPGAAAQSVGVVEVSN